MAPILYIGMDSNELIYVLWNICYDTFGVDAPYGILRDLFNTMQTAHPVHISDVYTKLNKKNKKWKESWRPYFNDQERWRDSAKHCLHRKEREGVQTLALNKKSKQLNPGLSWKR